MSNAESIPVAPEGAGALVPYRDNGRDMIVVSAQKALARPLSKPESFIFAIGQSLADWVGRLNAQGYPVGFAIGAAKAESYQNNTVTYAYEGTFTLNRKDKPPLVIGQMAISEGDRTIACVIPKVAETDISIQIIDCKTTHRRWFLRANKVRTWPIAVGKYSSGLKFYIWHPDRIESWKSDFYKFPWHDYFTPMNSCRASDQLLPFEPVMDAWIGAALAQNIAVRNDFDGIEIRPRYRPDLPPSTARP